MSDRLREKGRWLVECAVHGDNIDAVVTEILVAVEASPADLLAVVRRGVESGTIEGEVVEGRIATYVDGSLERLGVDSGIYMVIGPVPEGVEE